MALVVPDGCVRVRQIEGQRAPELQASGRALGCRNEPPCGHRSAPPDDRQHLLDQRLPPLRRRLAIFIGDGGPPDQGGARPLSRRPLWKALSSLRASTLATKILCLGNNAQVYGIAEGRVDCPVYHEEMGANRAEWPNSGCGRGAGTARKRKRRDKRNPHAP